MNKTVKLVAAIGVTWALAACGSTTGGDSPEALQERLREAAKTGSYAKMIAFCSPDTRAAAAEALVMAQAFDPKGEFLKAVADDPASPIVERTEYRAVNADGDVAVKSGGRWYSDCK